VVDAIVRRAVALAPAPQSTRADTWLLQGSLARREPLPGSDVDTALCWYDGDPTDHLAHASRVLRLVERAGQATCDRGANADNSLFNRSEDQWREAVAGWFSHEEDAGVLALASIVADSRPISGGQVSPLVEAVSAAASHEQFMNVLTRHTLSRRPPLGFVRDFVVHQSGEHRGQLDLKRGGLLPVSSLARWLALRTGNVSGSTPERLDRGADAGLITSDERDMLAGAYQVALTVLAEHQVRAIKAGEAPSGFLRPDQLDPLERRQLREAFRAIDGVQSALIAAAGLTRL
jgi:CBS domain-containing protein